MKAKKSNRKEARDLMWKTLRTREGKTMGASQQELYYDRCPITNVNATAYKKSRELISNGKS